MSETPKRNKIIIKKKSAGIKIRKKDDSAAESPLPPEASARIGLDGSVAPIGAREGKFSFFCSYCGEKIPTSKRKAGKTISCPVCDHEVTVPQPDQADAAVSKGKEKKSSQVVEESFKFFCVHCGQKLSAVERIVGKQISCPTCKHSITIPPKVDLPEEAVIEEEERPVDDIFKFFCMFCSQKLQARHSWIGQEVCCPNCESAVAVPTPPSK